MAQIFHTGREEYASQPNLGFNPSESVRQVGQDLVSLEKYRQALYMKREQEFLSLMDVKTDNLIFEQYQTIAADEIDKFVKEATTSHKNKYGILSTQDKIELMKKRQQMEMKVDGMRAKAKQFLDNKELYAQKRELFDIDETNSLFGEFMKDPVNKPVPNPVPKYYDPVYLVRKLADATYKYGQITERPVYVNGTEWTKEAYRPRVGIENEDDARRILTEWYDNDYELRRSSMKKYGDNFEALWNDTKDILLPVRSEKTGTKSTYTTGGYTTKNIKFYTTSDGVFGAAGDPLDVTISVDGKSVKADFVGMNADYITYVPKKGIDEPDYETTEQILKLAGKDNSTEEGIKEAANFIKEKEANNPQDKMVLNIYKRIFDLNSLIKEDGKWYFKKRAQEIKIPTTENSINDLSKGLSGYEGFNTELNAWKKDYFKSNLEPNNKSVKMKYLEWKKQNPNGTAADYNKYVNGR